MIKLFWKWILRNLNHLVVKPNKDWEALPAKKFFKVLDKNDLRYILKRYVVNYDQSRLMDIYENIMYQYEDGINEKNYSHKMRVVNDNLRKENEITALVICFELFKIDTELAVEKLKEWDVNLKDNSFESLIELRNIISGKRTTLTINAIIDNKNKEDVPVTFEETLVNFEDILKYQLDENMSLKKWVFYFKQCRQKIKQKKKYARST